MSKLVTLILALVAVVSVAEAGLVDLYDIEAAVAKRQWQYNADFDDSIVACGCNRSSPLCQQKVAAVMSVFCADGSFVSWVAPQPGPPSATAPPITSLVVLGEYYAFLAGSVFANFSRHQVTNVRVSVNLERGLPVSADLVAGLEQKAITVYVNPPIYTVNIGWYTNSYKVKSLFPTIEVCMTKFVSASNVNYVLAEPVPNPVFCNLLSTT